MKEWKTRECTLEIDKEKKIFVFEKIVLDEEGYGCIKVTT